MTPAELTGRSRSHVVDVSDPPCTLHAEVAVPFARLRRAAATAGFDLVPQSGFRDFTRQLSIWNAKFSGAAALYDASGRALDALALTPPERIRHILHWSALPGASRHHWGTDLDLIDRGAVASGYRVQLVPAEFAPPGPFAALAAWLEANAARFGFFRPFRGVRSGVQAEPWHFSFAPLAEPARRALTPDLLREALSEAPLGGKQEVLAALAQIHARYVASIDFP
ncbi:MAG TPA: M15 family metallopeptidase [Steroidobacteraceae bacterium]|nr:M15 family metallopeptidase [Steroidobacteraceae bacterium]HUO19942.1 M15 family metallopeptidase [Steroidobacteraceae bacterium]